MMTFEQAMNEIAQRFQVESGIVDGAVRANIGEVGLMEGSNVWEVVFNEGTSALLSRRKYGMSSWIRFNVSYAVRKVLDRDRFVEAGSDMDIIGEFQTPVVDIMVDVADSETVQGRPKDCYGRVKREVTDA